MTEWDERFLNLAEHIANWSKDPSTKVGCVVVGSDREIRSTGFNGFPRGIKDTPERLQDRDLKYPLICHAEENAIMHAARIGVSLKGCIAYVTWTPCARCARSLIQAGINEVVFPNKTDIPVRWEKEFTAAIEMLKEAGVEVRAI
jgi:dCMP deaminase